jgi:iron(III) transport system permease protein
VKRPLATTLCLYGAVVVFVALSVLPVLSVLVQGVLPPGRPPLSPFAEVYGARQVGLLARTLALAAGTTALACIVGLPVGFLLSRTDMPGRGVLRILSFAPLVLPPYVSAVAWIYLLGSRGALNVLAMRALGLSHAPIVVQGLGGALWCLALSFWPVVAVVSGAAFRRVDADLEDAALLDASRAATTVRVALPLAAPAILASALFVALLTLTEFGAPDLLMPSAPAYTTEIYAEFTGRFDTPRAAADSVPLVLIGLAMLAGVWAIVRRAGLVGSAGPRRPADIPLGHWRGVAFAVCLLAILVSAGLPLTALLVLGHRPSAYVAAVESLPTQARNSLVFAGAGAVVALALGIPMSYLISRGRRLERSFTAALAVLPIALPGAVVGIGLVWLFNKPWLFGNLPSAWRWPELPLAYAARFTPYAVGAVAVAFAQIATELDDAAAVEGAGWWQTLRRVLMPLSWRSVFAGAAVVFVLGMREIAASVLLYPPGNDTITMQVFQMMHYGADEQIAALCLMLVGVTLVPLAVLARVWREE